MIELFWDLYQQRRIRDAHQAADHAQAEALSARSTAMREAALTQERLDKIVLTVHAMWTLLAEKAGLTEADLRKRVTELDGLDGAVDGRVTRPAVRCSKCDAVVCRKFNRCLFCGQEYAGSGAFETL